MTFADYQNALREGQSLYSAADYAASEKLFARAVDAFPERPEGIAWLAKARMSLGSPADAMVLYERAFAKGLEKNAEHLTNLAICHAFKGDRDNARTLLEGAVAIDPFYEPAYGALARHCLIMGDYKAAVRYATEGVHLFPNNVPCFEARALARLAMLDLDGANEDALKATELDPKSTDGMLCQSNVLLARSQPSKAIELLERARQNDPDNCEVLLTLGNAFQMDRRLADAESCFRRASELQPLNWRVYQCLAALELIRENPEPGLDYVEAALELQNAPVLHCLRGSCLAKLSRPEEAKGEFALATAANPLDAISWVSLAGIEAENPQERTKAVEHAKRALALEPNGPVGERARQILRQFGG